MRGCLHLLQNSTCGRRSSLCANIETEVQSDLQSHLCMSELCAGWSLQAPQSATKISITPMETDFHAAQSKC